MNITYTNSTHKWIQWRKSQQWIYNSKINISIKMNVIFCASRNWSHTCLHSFKRNIGAGAKMKCDLNKRKTSESRRAGTSWPLVHDLQLSEGSIPWHSEHVWSRQQVFLNNCNFLQHWQSYKFLFIKHFQNQVIKIAYVSGYRNEKQISKNINK